MKIKYIFILFVFVALIQDFSNAQTSLWRRKRKEFIFGGGATNFLGELGGANQIGTNGMKDFNWPSVRPDFMIGYRYRTTRQTAVKTSLIYGRLSGNDDLTKEPYRNDRNLNFRTSVVELSSQFELTLTREKPGHIYNLKGIRGIRYLQITSYLFTGFGVMFFDPHGRDTLGNWHALRPLCTEGEGMVPTRKMYSLFQVVIPLGIGFKYALSSDWSVGIEYGIRKTFTDYIDDVSKTYFDPNELQTEKGSLAVEMANPSNHSLSNWKLVTAPGMERGDPTRKDSYMFSFISFYYKIPRGRFTLPKFR